MEDKRIIVPCPLCGGSGWHCYRNYYDTHNVYQDIERPCTMCEATGLVREDYFDA